MRRWHTAAADKKRTRRNEGDIMRKIDYAHLARIINDELALAKKTLLNKHASETEKLRADGAREAAQVIGSNFANVASIDKTEFLKACGIN
jgi:hypothetical protein